MSLDQLKTAGAVVYHASRVGNYRKALSDLAEEAEARKEFGAFLEAVKGFVEEQGPEERERD